MNEETQEIVSQVSAEQPVEQEVIDAGETEQSLENDEANAEPEQAQKDPWYKRRIDELTRDKHEARRQVERMEKMLEQLAAQQRQPEPVVPKIQPPDPSDFAGGQYDPRYVQAQLEYTRVSAVEEAKAAIAQEYEQRAIFEKQAQIAARIETAEASARSKFADYDAVIEGITSDPRLAQNQTIRQALLGTDNGPELAYVLGKNLDVAYEISQMNPIQAGMRLAELVNRAPRKVANAPTPIKPINATGGIGKKSYADMSTAEYIAARNAEERAAKAALYKR